MILCVAELLKDRRRAKITDVAREFDIAHSVVSRLWKSFKTTGMCSRRHGEVVLESRRLQKTHISSYQQKGTGTPQLSSTVLPVCNGVVSITIRLNRLACVLFSDESRFSLSSDCRRQLIWRESGTAYRPEKYPGKGPDIRHAVSWCGRHHDQWSHAPTCGCEWDYDGPTICLMKFYFLMFVFSVVLSEIMVFYGQQRNMLLNTRSGLSRQRGYSTSRMASAFSRSKPH
ncbi:hypothetical protein TNCV_2700701 [Trichonephila clavipes]|nr:hypothetical protein TNCV_2700701 [Trichonephila clavipes]